MDVSLVNFEEGEADFCKLYEPLRLEELFEVSHLVVPHHDQNHHLTHRREAKQSIVSSGGGRRRIILT